METIRWCGAGVEIIDQTLLPGGLERRLLTTVAEMQEAILHLRIRGAPALGVAAAYGLYLGARQFTGSDPNMFRAHCRESAAALQSVRPTAVNVAWALERMCRLVEREPGLAVAPARERLLAEAQRIQAEDRELCRRIGENGQVLITTLSEVITHCNAGALATAGEGTALSIIYAAARRGNIRRVYVDETRPLCQGARLTAWELSQNRIAATVICDSMAAAVLQTGTIRCAIVGADRIAANGDIANKIGTLGLAILCRHFSVPFYVAAPSTTIDGACATGDGIPIEIRPEDEIRLLGGRKQVPDACAVFNPAFDVTPFSLIEAIITEQGVHRPPYRESLPGPG